MEHIIEEGRIAWMRNKVRKGAMIYYRCQALHLSGTQCPHAASYAGIEEIYTCKKHTKKHIKTQSGGSVPFQQSGTLLSSPSSSTVT
jgi:hypothetical protein